MRFPRPILVLSFIFLLHEGVFSQRGPDIESIRRQDLCAHDRFLASDELEGREAGTRGEKLAAAYIAATFTRLGLVPMGDSGTYFQRFRLEQKKLGTKHSITVKSHGGLKTYNRIGEDFYVSPSSAGTEATGEVIFAGYGITAKEFEYDDYADLDVKGKIVLALGYEPQEKDSSSIFNGAKPTRYADSRRKRRIAQEHGAIGLMTVVDWGDHDSVSTLMKRFQRFLEGTTTRIAGAAGDIPAFSISSAIANQMLMPLGKSVDELQQSIDRDLKPHAFSISDVEITLHAEGSTNYVEAQNVVGLISGTDSRLKDETLILSAHYDHLGIGKEGQIYYGADDDASGTSAVMELAEAFALHPARRSVLCIAFTGEEKGLLGSQYYVDHPVVPLTNTITCLNVDMVGRIDNHYAPDSNYVFIIGADRLSTDLHKINEQANKETARLKLDYTFNDPNDPNRYYERSDHYNLAQKGIPVIFYTSGDHPDYHKPTDTWDKISFGMMETTVRLIYQTAWILTNRQDRLAIDNGKTSGSTH